MYLLANSCVDHPTIWEGHSSLIHEIARQLPSGVKPDAILCSVGGAGLLGGVLQDWSSYRKLPAAQVITLETIGANCFHLSLLANTEDGESQALIPDNVEISQRPTVSPDTQVRIINILYALVFTILSFLSDHMYRLQSSPLLLLKRPLSGRLRPLKPFLSRGWFGELEVLKTRFVSEGSRQ
jgi:hypothetical protein